jgi:hypothetical protein
MSNKTSENDIDKTLRHMTENLNGAYEAVHPPTHSRAGKRCTCSGTAIIGCCYINALGKVLLKGGPTRRAHPRPDFARFDEFVRCCMNDFLVESNARGLPPLPNGLTTGSEWLYQVYRCGFVHGLPRKGVMWGWNRRSNKYWFEKNGRIGLNVDELVRGFYRGIGQFKSLVNADPDLQLNFGAYLRSR